MVLSPSPQTKLCIMLWLWPIYGYVSFWLGLAKQFFTVFFFFFFTISWSCIIGLVLCIPIWFAFNV